jgi:hypothetical protein
MQTKTRFSILILAPLALAACAGKSDSGESGVTATTVGTTNSTMDESGGGESGTSGASSVSASGADTGGTDGGSDGGSEGQATSGGITQGFIMEPDGGGAMMECDVFAQDCAEGEKCMPWANDGGSAWNATKCSPLDPNPAQVGDPCTVEGSGVSGIDNCDSAMMCWDVDPETNMGTCVAFCTGSAADPMCEDPTTVCIIANEGVLALCLPGCDPLLQDCVEGQACYPVNEDFACAPDASGPDLGVYGDPCEYINACDPGLFCANPDVVPGCAGAAGCCSEFCDLTDAAGAMQCMGQGGGQDCTPWYAEGQAPPGYENVGACAIPM